MRYMGWIWSVVFLVTFALSGCGPLEKPITMDELLPAGYTEKVVPKDVFQEISDDISSGAGWIRCIDCDQDWEELKRHVSLVTSQHGYTESTSTWLPLIVEPSGLPDEHAQQMFKCYSSPSEEVHVFLMNLAYIRTLGDVSLGTTGDFIIVSGFDHPRNYR